MRNKFKPKIIIDKDLEKYNDVVLFPEKLAKANEMLEKYGLPDFILIKRHEIIDKKLEEAGKYVDPKVMRFLNEAMQEYAEWFLKEKEKKNF